MNMKKHQKSAHGIIFDLDGTLLDSLKDIALSLNWVLQSRGLQTFPIESYRYFVGSGLRELLYRALPETTLDERMVEEFANDFRKIYLIQWKENTRPYAGIISLLEKLNAMQVPLAILSNKPHDFTCRIVKECLSTRYFQPIYGARENAPKKPHPDAALQIAAAWNLDPRNILFIGDTPVDMETARKADMVPIGVAWGFRTIKELQESGASAILHQPHQLLEKFFARQEKNNDFV